MSKEDTVRLGPGKILNVPEDPIPLKNKACICDVCEQAVKFERLFVNIANATCSPVGYSLCDKCLDILIGIKLRDGESLSITCKQILKTGTEISASDLTEIREMRKKRYAPKR